MHNDMLRMLKNTHIEVLNTYFILHPQYLAVEYWMHAVLMTWVLDACIYTSRGGRVDAMTSGISRIVTRVVSPITLYFAWFQADTLLLIVFTYLVYTCKVDILLPKPTEADWLIIFLCHANSSRLVSFLLFSLHSWTKLIANWPLTYKSVGHKNACMRKWEVVEMRSLRTKRTLGSEMNVLYNNNRIDTS